MGRRFVLLVASALVAALGAGLLYVYASGIGTKASAGESISIYVASSRIDPGTSADGLGPDRVTQQQVAAGTVPSDAVTNLASLSGLTSVVTIFPGQALINSQFGESNMTGGLPIPVGKLAVAVQLGDPQRVAGFVQPGSTVTVFGTAGGKTTTLLKDVTVIAVGPATMTTRTQDGSTGTNSEQIPTAILTLALTEEQAKQLVGGVSNGDLYLGLQG